MSEQTYEIVETTELNSRPFKLMRKVKFNSFVHDFTSVLYPNGKTKIVVCLNDNSFRIIDLETLECEKIVNHSVGFRSCHFYKERRVLMTTDQCGDLLLWDLFSHEIEVIKKIKVGRDPKYSYLWRLIQVSSNLFFCSSKVNEKGDLHSIKFNNNNNDDDDVEVERIVYPLVNGRREPINCIYKLKSVENTILFGGGYCYDTAIKKCNYETKEHFRFPKVNSEGVNCITSYFNKENEEIVLSGGHGGKIIFWKVNGKFLKAVNYCSDSYSFFLIDFQRKNIFVVDNVIYSLSLETEELVMNEEVRSFHKRCTTCAKWVDEEKQNCFLTGSEDSTLNIFGLEKTKKEEDKDDIEERLDNLIRGEDFIGKFCKNKKNLFQLKLGNNLTIKDIFKVLLL